MTQASNNCIAKCVKVALFGTALMVLPALYVLGVISL